MSIGLSSALTMHPYLDSQTVQKACPLRVFAAILHWTTFSWLQTGQSNLFSSFLTIFFGCFLVARFPIRGIFFTRNNKKNIAAKQVKREWALEIKSNCRGTLKNQPVAWISWVLICPMANLLVHELIKACLYQNEAYESLGSLRRLLPARYPRY